MTQTTDPLEAIKKSISEDIRTNKVVLYMKGNKSMPQCGFSAKVVHILDTLGCTYLDKNVLLDDTLRQGIKDFSQWPTVPQLYIDGEFVGGCDIVTQLSESGQLQELLTSNIRDSL